MLGNSAVKNTITCVATSLAAMLDAEVMITDDNRNVLAGTVSSKQDFHISMVYNHILKEKKLVVIERPGMDALCKGCTFYGRCRELIEINAPILLKDSCIGIISVTCYEGKQRDRILEKLKACCSFIMQMSILLASRAQEVFAKHELQLSASRLSTIIDAVDEGIISLDRQGHVNFCNSIAADYLSASEKNIMGHSFTEYCPEFASFRGQLPHSKHELMIRNAFEKQSAYYLDARPILIKGESAGTIVTLERPEQINRLMGNFIGSQPLNLNTTDIISVGESLERVKQRAKRVSSTDSTVLIRGESGTGKELFARAIHNMSPRSAGPFIALNCAAIPDSLLESELFGYESGSFTGAKKGGKPGRFELADTGTIFLDEIGDMPIHLQVKLLRVIQEQVIQRIGSTKDKKIDIRIISATNKNLEKMVAENSFREDLFYRLNVIPLVIPPLRERGDADIEALISCFVNKYSTRFGRRGVTLTDEVREILLHYSWPGNVRQLENAVEYMLNMEPSSHITVDSLPEYIRKDLRTTRNTETLKEQMALREREILTEEIARHGHSLPGKKQIARTLGISIASLYRKLRDYNLE